MKAFSIPIFERVTHAALGTPLAWLAGHGWTNDVDQAELSDTDGDGLAAWQEYIAGTVPTNRASRFTVSVDPRPGAMDVVVETQPGRTYRVEWANQPGAQNWRAFADDAAGTYAETGSETGEHRFIDDFGPDTTGHAAAPGQRAYRVWVAVTEE